jgi:gliding motility-associated lipoprotein GldB
MSFYAFIIIPLQNKSNSILKFKKYSSVKHLPNNFIMQYYFIILLSFLILSCNSNSKVEKEIEKIPVDVNIVRFDKEFAATTPESLPEIKKKFSIFFPKQFHDSIWLDKINDTLQKQLNFEVAKKFPNEDNLEDKLYPLFQHIKYYFPEFKSPTIVTTTSDVDYNNPVIISDTLMVLSLDTYLGSDHFFYEGIPKYITENLNESHIAPDVATAYARQLIAIPRKRTLLAQMVFFGKELYLKDLWLPNTPDEEKIGYTKEQLEWVKENETEMWRYFIENELLYSTDPRLPARFVNPAPFSKFFLEIDNESPGMTGRYIGWQIVRSYMENNDISIKELMQIDVEKLYEASKYKPKKK